MNFTEEESILSQFKDSYEHFPIGKITHPNKPDFIIEGQQKIGIEVTQVFKDQDSPKGSLIKAKDTFRRKLLSNIVSELKATSFPNCIVAVHLNEQVYSKTLNPRTISKRCLEDVLSKQPVIKEHGDYEFENEGNLPEIIEAYTISVFDGLKETEYIETTGAIGLALTNEYIQFVLTKKEEAKKDFKNCDLFWLLIKEGSFEADYFGILSLDSSKLQTTFDKVFLFRQRNSEIVELK